MTTIHSDADGYEMARKSRRRFVVTTGYSFTSLLLAPFSVRARSLSKVLDVSGGVLGAYGDGKRDATAVIQALIDGQPGSGGSVVIPAGKYLINVEKGVILRSGIHLSLLPGAIFIATPTTLGQSSIIKIHYAHNVSVSGGLLVGERDQHLGHTGEWGFGVDVRASSSVTLSNIVISECWGDGIYIGALILSGRNRGCSDVIIRDVTSARNRRQGLSIVACNGVRIIGSKFLFTKGTPPSAGIDLEPNGTGVVENVVIHDCDVLNNAGSGIQTWNSASKVEISDCRIYKNGGWGVYLGGKVDEVTVHDNQISCNRENNVFVGKGVKKINMSGNISTPS